MEKEFVPSLEAFELKVLGFDEPCFGLFTRLFRESITKLLVKEMPNQNECELYFGGILAPTFSQVFRWFEDKHFMFIERSIDTNVNEILNISYVIKSWKFTPIEITFENPYDCFDRGKAELACLKELIKIVKGEKSLAS